MVGRRGAQSEQPSEIGLGCRRQPFQALWDRGLDQAQPCPGQDGGHGLEPDRAGDSGDENQQPGQYRRRPAPHRGHWRHRGIAQSGRQRGYKNGHETEPIDADPGDALQHQKGPRKTSGPGIADQIPRQPGQGVTTDPFARAPGDGKDEDPRQRGQMQVVADEPGREQHQPYVQRKSCWQPRRSKWHQPPETIDIDKQRRRDPIEPGEKKAEAEDPAEPERGPGVGAAVVEPQQAREDDRQQRRQVERRQCRCSAGPQHKGEPVAPPPGKSGQSVGQPAQRRVDPGTGPSAEQRDLTHYRCPAR